jgi:tetratricopeptide (TPR) repeat protein
VLLMERAYGHSHLEEALALSRSVVESTEQSITERARGVAAIYMALAQDLLDHEWDERFVQAGIEKCVTDAPYYAGCGLGLLADRHLARGERLAATEALERAADLFDRAGSALGGPGALRRLAVLAIEDNRPDAARAYLDRGLDRLAQFPFYGFMVRGLEKKLLTLRATLEDPRR